MSLALSAFIQQARGGEISPVLIFQPFFQLSEEVIVSSYKLKNADNRNGWIRFAILVSGYNSIEIIKVPLNLPESTIILLRFRYAVQKYDITTEFMCMITFICISSSFLPPHYCNCN